MISMISRLTTLTARNFAEMNELLVCLKDVARGEVVVLVAFAKQRIVVA